MEESKTWGAWGSSWGSVSVGLAEAAFSCLDWALEGSLCDQSCEGCGGSTNSESDARVQILALAV